MHLRNLLIITLCSLTYSVPTFSMITSAIKKFTQMQRYTCYFPNTLGKAPCNIEHFLKQMPKKLNFTDTKNTIPEIDTLNVENKNLMLAHILWFIYRQSNYYGLMSSSNKQLKLKIEPEIVMAIVQLVKAGADPNTLIEHFYNSPALMLVYEENIYPLRIALELENIRLIQFLLHHGANSHGPEDLYGFSCAISQEPIFYTKKVKFAKILFDYGLKLDIEEKKEHYKRLIDYNTNIEFIKLYLKHGVPINSTILHLPDSEYDRPELLSKTKMFIKNAPYIVNVIEGGRTPLDKAQKEIMDLFQDENIKDIARMERYVTLLEKNGAKTAAELKNLE